jgi:uncharacterized membrane protein YdjX (TVP38/TMEM64 family)
MGNIRGCEVYGPRRFDVSSSGLGTRVAVTFVMRLSFRHAPRSFVTGRRAAILRLAVLPFVVGIALLAAWKLGYFELDRRQELYDRVQRIRVVSGSEMMFIGAYVLAVTLCLPTTILIVLGGAVFGFAYGSTFSFAGAIVGTVVAYLVSRRLARRPAERIFGNHRVLEQLRERDGFLVLFRLRVLPIAPYGVLPYVSGIAGARMRLLLAATAVGSLPSILAYSWLGNELLIAATTQGETSKRALWIAAGVTLGMLALSMIPSLLRRLRRT